jgi:hypothetical protein
VSPAHVHVESFPEVAETRRPFPFRQGIETEARGAGVFRKLLALNDGVLPAHEVGRHPLSPQLARSGVKGTVNGSTEGSQRDADPAAEPPSDDPPPAAPEDDGGVAAAAAPPGGGGGGPEEYSSQLGYENLNKLKLTSDVTAETTALLGETIDLNTGAISFEQIDVLLPGNSDLEVAIRRTFKGKSAFAWLDVHPFENWLLDIPYIHTNQVYSTSAPSTLSGPWGFGRECAMDMTSGIATFQGNSYTQDMWWTGDTLHVPGKVHDKLLMNNGTAVITSGSYPKVTASNWRVSCIDRFENGVKVGEGSSSSRRTGSLTRSAS